MTAETAPARLPSRAACLLAALVPALLFVWLARPALRELSATYDETEHVPAGYTYVARGDYRLGPEHPPLLKQLFGRAVAPLAPAVSPQAERAFEAARRDIDAHWIFGDRFLYRDNAPVPLLARARAVSVALGALLVLLIGTWAGRAFGLAGGVLAAGGAALDPNLLAHGALATTDLGFTLWFVATLYGARCCFRRLTVARAAGTALAAAAAVASKHSALLLAPALLAFAVLRVADGRAWSVGRRERRAVRAAGPRAAVALVLLSLWALAAWGGLWTVYGWRYAATADAGPDLPIGAWTQQMRVLELTAERLAGGAAVPAPAALAAEAAATPPGLGERLITAAAAHRLAPEGYLFGLAFASAMAKVRRGFLLGEISLTGWTGYFPFALLVKTPLATLALAAAALALLGAAAVRRGRPALGDAALAVVPPVIVLGAAMTSNLNIGYRHVLPLVPFLYLLAGWLPRALAPRPGSRRPWLLTAAALALLACETAPARPYFLSFFNAAAGGPRGGLALLSDSNLDWGQGLPALARWMDGTGVERVNLCYFGTADPAAYGVRFVPLPGTYELQVPGAGRAGYPPRAPELPGWVAISATHLQGTYLFPAVRRYYAFLVARAPDAVVAESIYLYRVERWGEWLAPPRRGLQPGEALHGEPEVRAPRHQRLKARDRLRAPAAAVVEHGEIVDHPGIVGRDRGGAPEQVGGAVEVPRLERGVPECHQGEEVRRAEGDRALVERAGAIGAAAAGVEVGALVVRLRRARRADAHQLEEPLGLLGPARLLVDVGEADERRRARRALPDVGLEEVAQVGEVAVAPHDADRRRRGEPRRHERRGTPRAGAHPAGRTRHEPADHEREAADHRVGEAHLAIGTNRRHELPDDEKGGEPPGEAEARGVARARQDQRRAAEAEQQERPRPRRRIRPGRQCRRHIEGEQRPGPDHRARVVPRQRARDREARREIGAPDRVAAQVPDRVGRVGRHADGDRAAGAVERERQRERGKPAPRAAARPAPEPRLQEGERHQDDPALLGAERDRRQHGGRGRARPGPAPAITAALHDEEAGDPGERQDVGAPDDAVHDVGRDRVQQDDGGGGERAPPRPPAPAEHPDQPGRERVQHHVHDAEGGRVDARDPRVQPEAQHGHRPVEVPVGAHLRRPPGGIDAPPVVGRPERREAGRARARHRRVLHHGEQVVAQKRVAERVGVEREGDRHRHERPAPGERPLHRPRQLAAPRAGLKGA